MSARKPTTTIKLTSSSHYGFKPNLRTVKIIVSDETGHTEYSNVTGRETVGIRSPGPSDAEIELVKRCILEITALPVTKGSTP